MLGAADRARLIELAREGRLRDHWQREPGLCELPRAIADFTGRAAEPAWVGELVRAEHNPGAGVVGVITGPAGPGKTTLALRAAHAVRPGFPDGVLFLDLLGMSQRPVAPDDALRQLLRALGVAEQRIPGDTEARAALYRSLLRDRRTLVVLDNAASEEQVRPLLPGGGTGRALLTTRRLLPGLEGVRRLALGPLPAAESMHLLTGILGERSATDGTRALARLADLCGGLPLALRIVGNRLFSRPRWDAAELAARLANDERRLDQMTAGDLKIANAFGLSYEQLAAPARRMFRRLALVPGADFDATVAGAAGGMARGEAWEALDDLVDLGLLHDGAAGRYRFHDLVRLFARERLYAEEPAAEREALTVRVTAWLLGTATLAGRWFEPGYGAPDATTPDVTAAAPAAPAAPASPASPASPFTPSDAEEADRWLRRNVDNWLGALRTASADGTYALVLDCAEAMHWFSDQWVHGPHWQEVFTLGADAAAHLGDLAQQATQLNHLAWVHAIPLNDPETALRHATTAVDLAARLGATAQIAWAHGYTAVAQRRLGRFDEAVASAIRAVELVRPLGDAEAYLSCTINVGHCLRDRGRHDEAIERYHEGLALIADADSGLTPSIAANLRADTLAHLGRCPGALGRRDEAIGTLTEAIALMRAFDPTYVQAGALETLAAHLSDADRTAESRHTYARAAEVYETIGDLPAATRCRERATPAP
ncbi:tetratricopeptide repeat protein [Streptomyces sp. NPDC048659]|uniref:tetratricopeptide repeat protein n=1 Tax=Streptomyces sp. NPDC048659 TaxID=3155489 RepID=UPI00341F2D30